MSEQKSTSVRLKALNESLSKLIDALKAVRESADACVRHDLHMYASTVLTEIQAQRRLLGVVQKSTEEKKSEDP